MFPLNPPFQDKISVCGFPYRGIIKSGTLTTGDGLEFSHVQPDDGLVTLQTNVIGASAVRNDVQQSFDAANGFDWQESLIFSGRNRMIGGQALGGNRWIYCDEENRSWVIRFDVAIDGTDLDITITLESLFALIESSEYTLSMSTIDRVLASVSYPIGTGGFEMQYLPDEDITHDGGLEVVAGGELALINVYQANVSTTAGYFMFDNTYTELGGVVRVALSGAGSLIENAEESIDYGDGIEAAVSLLVDHTVVWDASYDHVVEDNIDGGAGGWALWLPDYIYPVKDGTTYNYNWDETDRSKNSSYFREQGEKTVFRYVFDDSDNPFQCHLINGSRRLITRTGASTGFYDGGWIINCSARCDRVEDLMSGVMIYFPNGSFDIGTHSIDTSYNIGKDNPTVVSESFPYEFYPDVEDYESTGTSVPTKIGGEIELLDGHTINARTTGLLTNVMHVSGAKYTNSAAMNVSYNPITGEWAADATNRVCWA